MRAWLTCALLLLVLGTAGCSGAQPYRYHSPLETPSGPGLFSGKDGAFGSAPVAAD